MRARIFAVLLLIALLGIPAFLYWYFTERKISSLELHISGEQSVRVILSGTFSSRWLPLADKMLSYQKDCSSVCNFDPIIPAVYSIQVIPVWRPDIAQTDTVDLASWQKVVREYRFAPQVEFVPRSYSWDIIQAKEQVIRLRLQEDESMELLGMSIDGKIYVRTRASLWQVVDGKYRPLMQLSPDILSVMLDKTGEFFVLTYKTQVTRVIKRDLSIQKDVPIVWVIAVAMLWDGDLKVLTDDGVFFVQWEKLRENVRFTDFIDISRAYRIGYIDRWDTKKLSLSNLSLESTWILLSRTDWGAQIFKKWFSNSFLFTSGNQIYSLWDDGSLWEIRVPE